MEDIKKMYVEELRALAKSKGVPGADDMKKAELIGALEAAQADRAGAADPKEVLFRKFPPGSEPVKSGSPPGYTPDTDPQAGEPDPVQPAAAQKPGPKVGAPIGKHRSPKQVFADAVAAIDKEMSAAERQALETLRRAGWSVMVYPHVENAYIDTAVRSYRVRGRYDIGVFRKKTRR